MGGRDCTRAAVAVRDRGWRHDDRRHCRSRGLQQAPRQYDDLPRLPCARSRQCRRRRWTTTRGGRCAPLRSARRGAPAPDARARALTSGCRVRRQCRGRVPATPSNAMSGSPPFSSESLRSRCRWWNCQNRCRCRASSSRFRAHGPSRSRGIRVSASASPTLPPGFSRSARAAMQVYPFVDGALYQVYSAPGQVFTGTVATLDAIRRHGPLSPAPEDGKRKRIATARVSPTCRRVSASEQGEPIPTRTEGGVLR
jgi:hypothetical protein